MVSVSALSASTSITSTASGSTLFSWSTTSELLVEDLSFEGLLLESLFFGIVYPGLLRGGGGLFLLLREVGLLLLCPLRSSELDARFQSLLADELYLRLVLSLLLSLLLGGG